MRIPSIPPVEWPTQTGGQTEPDEKLMVVVGHLLKVKRNAKPAPSVSMNIHADDVKISVSESFLPYGRLLRCELVNTVDSTNIDTPIIGWSLIMLAVTARRLLVGRLGGHKALFVFLQESPIS